MIFRNLSATPNLCLVVEELVDKLLMLANAEAFLH